MEPDAVEAAHPCVGDMLGTGARCSAWALRSSIVVVVAGGHCCGSLVTAISASERRGSDMRSTSAIWESVEIVAALLVLQELVI